MSKVNGDVEPSRRKMGINEHSLEYQIIATVNRIKAKHIVLDPLNSLMINVRGAADIRYLVHKLFETIRDLDCSALITYEGVFDMDNFYSEMFLSDGVISLIKDLREFQTIKTIRIDKMRGIDFDYQPRRYLITGTGMVVLDKESVLV